MRRFLSLLFACAAVSRAEAQVKPNSDWRTIRTERFSVHYTPDLEDVARRAAVQAESAYVELSRFMRPPRGRIDIVISDDFDIANGYATPYPTNRIGVYANPPIFDHALRFTDDFLDLVVTHELAHVFHLDRSAGWWGLAQRLTGRNPLLFPNTYHPRWLTEGLAVYFESRLTGSGRVLGSEHQMIARSAALAHAFPRIDQMTLANPHFPYGYSAYAYGSLLMDFLGRSHGDSAMRVFVEASSRRLLPWTLNGPARRAFGRSFTAAFRAWADSMNRDAATAPDTAPMPGWLDLTVDGAYANYPRWLDDSTIVYVGTPGDESFGAYQLHVKPSYVRRSTSDVERQTSYLRRGVEAPRQRLGRRNSRSPQTRMPDGSLAYAQLEYTSLYNARSDLYMDDARGGTVRLTRGQRLGLPDARGDGLLVAVQTVTAGTRLALVGDLGRVITPITSGSMDEQWSEPSWSPDGRHIAAARWLRGGTGEIVVIDTAGRIVQTLLRERAIASTPSWSPDGRWVYFSSDRDGVPNLYRGAFNAGATEIGAFERVSVSRTGLFEPVVSPNGRQIAAVVFRADGYHVGVAPIDTTPNAQRPTPSAELVQPTRDLPLPAPYGGPSTNYSPWRLLLPRYVMPIYGAALDTGGVRLGVVTSSEDIVGRHAYDASILVPTDGSGLTGAVSYRNASFGWPVDVFYSQDWENRGLIVDQSQQGAIVGTLRRRIRDASFFINLPRPRIRTFAFLNVGAGIEVRDYTTSPVDAIARVDSLYTRRYYYPRVTTSFGWSNVQFPLLAVSPEDGISFSATTRHRWRSSPKAQPDSILSPSDPQAAARTITLSIVSALSAYKSLDLPGFSHHVIALRGAGGIQDNRGTSYFEVGGASGGVVDVIPGYVLGEGRRTFSVRGFEPGTLVGMRAFQGSAEYRAPLRIPGRGLGSLPLFLDRTSLTFFGDAGGAWCPGVFPLRPAPATSLCTSQDVDAGVLTKPDIIASAGGELALTAAVLSWDVPYRWRLGYAVPITAPQGYALPAPRAYFAVGVSF